METVDDHELTEFEQAVTKVLAALQPGDVVTYGEVAVEAGYSARASRSVGGFLSRHGGQFAWWRVVNAEGRLAPHKQADQAQRLRSEGVEIRAERVVGFARHSLRRT